MENIPQAILEDFPVGYWDLNVVENTGYLCPTFKSMLGYEDHELSPSPEIWENLIYPEDFPMVMQAFNAHVTSRGKIPFKSHVRYIHKSGSIVWIACTGRVVEWDSDFNPVRMLGCHIDITQRKEAEEKLKSQNRRFNNILTGTQTGTWELNIQSRTVIFNERWADIIGYSMDELPSKSIDTWLNLIHPDDYKRNEKVLKQHLKGKTKFYECEMRMKHKAGHWVWVLNKGKVTSQTAEGLPLQMSGSIQDITQRKNYEIKLAHYKDLLERTNQVARIGTWEMDLRTNQSVWSQVTRNIHGVDETFQPTIETGINFFIEEHREKITNAVNSAIQNCESYDVELQIATTKNKLKWIRAIGIPEFENDKCTRLYGLFQDIDEKKSAEIEIKNSLERNRIFIEQSPMAIAMLDKDMRYIAASQKWMQDYHLQGKEIIGISHYEIFPEISDEWRDIHQECLRGAINQCDEAPFKRLDGSVQWLTWDIRPWYRSENKIGGLILYTSDITEKKLATLSLAHSEERFRQTFEHAAIGMALISTEGKWLKVNPQVCNIIGYTQEELMQKTFQDITHPDDLETDLSYVIKLLNNEIATYQMEKRYFHKNGSIVWVVLAVSLVRDEQNTPLYFVSQIKNITERKESQRRLENAHHTVKEQNSRLMNFAHIVSHNLRSHTGNLEMMLKFLSEETREDEKQFLLKNIKGISTSLSETITHLTEVVKIQTSSVQKKETLHLRHFLDKTINTLSADLRKSEGEIIVDVPEDADIIFNPAYLDSVLLNFLTNALKYRHPHRKPMVRIWMEESDDYLILSIADNGLGIDLEKYGAKLFGLYKTFHQHADARGVGLFITKNQIEAMGGKVEVESTLDIGTTFKLYFCYEKNRSSLYY
uniref:histidine kinase n=1 Tax=Roseihalotalea indica TaxID=2867963 RepID=A0AA49GMZ9_9BACT|nr:PAS domain S-box protein [Tunicatimonas sp. TK19036]